MRTVRLAIGLKSTAQSLALVGLAAGSFRDVGIDLQIARSEIAGPAAISGLLEGQWEIAEFGAVPVVQWALEGKDPLILLAAEPRSALYILGAKGVEQAEQLKGREVGVLTAAGQTGYSATEMLRRWGLAADVKLIELGRYPAIFEALRAGRIAAGVLTADYRFAAGHEDGFSVLCDLGEEFRFQGPVVVTTKRLAAAEPRLIAAIVEGYARALRAFQQDAKLARAVLAAHLDFATPDGIAHIYEFYAKRFSAIPRPSMTGLQEVLDSFAHQYPAAALMRPQDVYAARYLDDLETAGFFSTQS